VLRSSLNVTANSKKGSIHIERGVRYLVEEDVFVCDSLYITCTTITHLDLGVRIEMRDRYVPRPCSVRSYLGRFFQRFSQAMKQPLITKYI
jgi:hypothetical protein